MKAIRFTFDDFDFWTQKRVYHQGYDDAREEDNNPMVKLQ
jgi:hypothetical protein